MRIGRQFAAVGEEDRPCSRAPWTTWLFGQQVAVRGDEENPSRKPAGRLPAPDLEMDDRGNAPPAAAPGHGLRVGIEKRGIVRTSRETEVTGDSMARPMSTPIPPQGKCPPAAGGSRRGVSRLRYFRVGWHDGLPLFREQRPRTGCGERPFKPETIGGRDEVGARHVGVVVVAVELVDGPSRPIFS